MNQTRLAVAVLLVFLTAASWAAVLGGKAAEMSRFSQTLEQARTEEAQGLYARAISSYEDALSQKRQRALYEDLDRVYALYYQEDPSGTVRNRYTDMLTRANADYPKETAFWERHIQIYLDRKDYTKAVKLLRRAQDKGVSSETMEKQFQSAYYVFKTGYQSYPQLLPGCWKGDYVVQMDGENWGMVTSDGSAVLSGVYPVMGSAGTSGRVAVTDGDGVSWLVDAKGVKQVRYEQTLAEAGCWSEAVLPARLAEADIWSYLSDDGQTLLTGYLKAGSFYDGKAAVQTDEGWLIIDENGTPVSEERWEDIRLNADGDFRQDGCILAKSDGQWHIYSTSWKAQGEFQCDDIDVCVDGPIAFCKDGLWGFVSPKGKVLIEPAYEQARSFSGGTAAVCRDGLWGFIDEEGREVVAPQFADAGYFDPKADCCPVRLADTEEWRFIQWVVER